MEKGVSVFVLRIDTTWEEAWKTAPYGMRETVLRRALSLLQEEKRKQFPKDWYWIVKRAVSEGVRIVDGFAPGHAWKAPPFKILQAIKNHPPAPRWGGELLKIGVLVWMEEHQKLVDRIRAWLQERGYLWNNFPLDEHSRFASRWWVAESLHERVLSQLRQDFEGEGEENLLLALWVLWRHIVVPDHHLTEMFQKQKFPEQLQDILEELGEIPPNSQAWDVRIWPDFLRYIETIAANKRLAYGLEKEREELKRSLADLSVWKAMYEDLPIAHWRVESLPNDQISAVLEKVRHLLEALECQKSLMERRPSKISDLQRWNQQVSEVLTKINHLIQDLNQAFAIKSDQTSQAVQQRREKERETDAETDAETEEGEQAKEAEFIPQPSRLEVEGTRGPEEKRVIGKPEDIEEISGQEQVMRAEQLSQEGEVEETQEEGERVRPVRKPSSMEIAEELSPEAHKHVEEETEDKEIKVKEDLRAQAHLLSALKESDIALAYWIAWAQEALGQKPIFAFDMLIGLQIAHWLTELWPQRDMLLLDELTRWRLRVGEKVDQVGKQIWGPWIALVAILSGDANPWLWLDWIPSQDEHWRYISPSLAQVWQGIYTLVQKGGSLDLVHVFEQEDENEEILPDMWAARAKTWLENAPHWTFAYQRASWLWKAMVRDVRDGEKRKYSISQWLRLVAQDERTRKDEVRRWVEEWQADLEGKLDEANDMESKRRGKFPERIEGKARATLLRRIRDALNLATNWLHAVEIQERQQRGRKGVQKRYAELRSIIRNAIEQAPHEIRAFLHQGNQEQALEKQIALEHLANWIEGMQRYCEQKEPHPSGIWHRLVLPEDMNVSRLSVALGSRIFARTAQVTFTSTEQEGLRHWEPERPEDVLRWCLQERISPVIQTTEDVIQQWARERQNFQLALIASELLPEEHKEETQLRLEDWWVSTLEVLHKEIVELIPKIEAAMRDGLLPEQDYQNLNAELVQLKESLLAYRKLRFSLGNTDDLRPIQQGLERVRRRLETFEQRRIQELDTRKEDLIRQIKETWGHTSSLVDQAQKHIERLEQNRDWRGLTEYFLRLEEAITKSRQDLINFPDISLFSINTLRRFGQHEWNIYRRLTNAYKQGTGPSTKVWKDITESSIYDWFITEHLPGPRKTRTRNAARAWLDLKRRKASGTVKYWHALLEFLGFPVTSPQRHITPDRVQFQNIERWKIRIASPLIGGIAEDNWIPPTWGSLADGEYFIVGLWDRPDPRQVISVLQDGARKPQLLFYFGALHPHQRREWGKALRREGIPALLIDEVVFWFLVGQRDVQHALFYCTLPFTYINPYYPTGTVAEEMFFGKERREQLLSALLAGRIGVLYGGRQLGKTALLKRAQETFHRPRDKQAAFYIDLKKTSVEIDPELGLWQSLGGKLSQRIGDAKWLSRITKDPGQILQTLEEKVREGWSVRLFLDEADELLRQESARGFPVILRFRELEMIKRGGFKVVLAGLHNVQRYTRLPNHPLAQLGEVHTVGPLSYRDAEQLLIVPLAGLGIEIGTEETLRVLSYTNRHPGLMQLFAKKIVEAINTEVVSGRRDFNPPFRVNRDLIEQIYDNPQVRSEIRKRFLWTIDLDVRYRAIALYMAIETMDNPHAFDHWYHPKEITQALEGWLEWEKTSPPSLMEVTDILSEMEGLGILVSDKTRTTYRMRSPNLIPLLGEHREIEQEFLKITITDPALHEDSQRLRLSDGRFAPLDEGERRLIFHHPVTLIIGSPDTGIKEIKTTLQHFAELVKDQWKFETFYPQSKQIHHLRKRFGQGSHFQKQIEKGYQLLVMLDIPHYWDAKDIHAWFMEAIRLAPRIEKIGRLIFVMDQVMALEWVRWLYRGGKASQLAQIKEQINFLPLQKWNQFAVQQALQVQGYLATEEESASLLQRTGGWHVLIQETFMQAQRKGLDPNTSLLPLVSEVRRKAHEGVSLATGHAFLDWLKEIPSDSNVLDFLKALQHIWDTDEAWPFEEVRAAKDLIEERLSLKENVEALWQYYLWMGILEKRTSQEGVFYIFDPLVRKRLTQIK